MSSLVNSSKVLNGQNSRNGSRKRIFSPLIIHTESEKCAYCYEAYVVKRYKSYAFMSIFLEFIKSVYTSHLSYLSNCGFFFLLH